IVAIRVRKEITNEWALGFGCILLFSAAVGALAMVWVIGAYALVFGTLMIFLAFRPRGRPADWKNLTEPRNSSDFAIFVLRYSIKTQRIEGRADRNCVSARRSRLGGSWVELS